MAKRCSLAHSSFAFARPRPCSTAAGPDASAGTSIEHLRACLQDRGTRWPASESLPADQPEHRLRRQARQPELRQETGRRVGITAQDLRADRFLREAPPVAATRSKLTHLFGISDPAGAVAVLRTGAARLRRPRVSGTCEPQAAAFREQDGRQ